MALVNRLLHFYWRFSRGLTVGVRAAVLDSDGRVFLVKHTYAKGWHLPGGGVEAGETLLQALARELAEEGNIEMRGPAAMVGYWHNAEATAKTMLPERWVLAVALGLGPVAWAVCLWTVGRPVRAVCARTPARRPQERVQRPAVARQARRVPHSRFGR